jgi:hypothetical protein
VYFRTINEQVKNNAIKAIEGLNGVYEIEIKKYRKNRSNAQNRLMWMWLGIISDETGNSAEDLHSIFKMKFLGSERITALGTTFERPKSTTMLTTTQFSDYLDKIEGLATQCQIILPHPVGLYEDAHGL